MEPVSFIVSAITIAASVRSALNLVKDIRGAYDDVLALSNEISDITLVLQKIGNEAHPDDQPIPSASILSLAESIGLGLSKLGEEITEWNILPRNRLAKASQLRWLRIGSRAKAWRARIRDLRLELITVLVASSACDSSRIVLEFRNILIRAERISANQQLLLQKQQSGDLLRQSDGLNSTMKLAASLSETTSDDSLKHSGNSAHSISDASTLVDTSTEAGVDTYSTNEVFESSLMPVSSLASNDSEEITVTGFSVQTTYFAGKPCKRWCSCTCHKTRRLRTPPLLDAFIGRLFVDYSGMPAMLQECDTKSCHSRSRPWINITYAFPYWFLARTISFVAAMQFTKIVTGLEVQRTVPSNAEIFTCAKLGNIERLTELFIRRLASPNDVHYESGVTAMHFAVSHQRFDVCKLLLQAGADPFLCGRGGRASGADKAWSRIFSNSLSPESERTLRLLFSKAETLERRGFTVLHQIILGLFERSLQDELRNSTAELNAQDSLGRTPTSLAAERGDSESVSTLLKHGADACIPAFSGSTPLCYAARASDPSCIKLLLGAGAEVNSKTDWDQTALHYAAAHNNNRLNTELLLRAGADPNAVDKDGRTPLGFTPIPNHVDVAACLVEHGALIRGANPKELDPLILSIEARRHELVELFISLGFRIDVSMPMNNTLLHTIAAHADEEMMRLFSRVDFHGVSAGQKNDAGYAPIDLLRQRTDLTEGIVSAFSTLISSTNQEESKHEKIIVEVWEDACETL